LAVADADGRVIGGHLLDGCTVRTTAEIVLGLLDGLAFAREVDPSTGWRELLVTPVGVRLAGRRIGRNSPG
jgi:predicted DNA-binding protein with PD1-like motif